MLARNRNRVFHCSGAWHGSFHFKGQPMSLNFLLPFSPAIHDSLASTYYAHSSNIQSICFGANTLQCCYRSRTMQCLAKTHVVKFLRLRQEKLYTESMFKIPVKRKGSTKQLDLFLDNGSIVLVSLSSECYCPEVETPGYLYTGSC